MQEGENSQKYPFKPKGNVRVRTLYNILFTVLFVLSSPYYFWRMWRRGNWQPDFWQRFGYYDANLKQAITNRHVLWIHAVSVGEVNLCTQMIRLLEQRMPNLKIVVSTTTTTGMGELQRRLPTHISRIYYPVDGRKWVARALATIHPEAVVLVVGDLAQFPVAGPGDGHSALPGQRAALERSYRGYKRFGFLFRPLFSSFAGVGVQSNEDAVRVREVGCSPEAIRVVGSLKYDAAKLTERRPLDVTSMLRRLGVGPEALLLVGGSTHAGEEALLAEQFLRLRARFPSLFLVLVPRHFERSKDVGRELKQQGVRLVYRSEILTTTSFEPGELDCLVVNSTGELRVLLRTGDGDLCGQEPDGAGRAESDRAGGSWQGDGVRPAHAKFRPGRGPVLGGQRGGAGGGCGGVGARARQASRRRRGSAASWRQRVESGERESRGGRTHGQHDRSAPELRRR